MKKSILISLFLLIGTVLAYAAWDGATNFPGALDDSTSLYDVTDGPDQIVYAAHHDAPAQAVIAIETKLGTGASTATSNTVLRGTGAGTTAYGQANLATDITGTLPVANGGTNEITAAGVKSAFEIDAPNKSFAINQAVATDDFLLWLTPIAITITDIKGVLQSGTNVVGGLDEVDSDGTSNLTAVDADITFDGGLDEDDGSLTNGTIAANHWVKWHTTSVSSPGYLTISIWYTID